MKFTVIAETNEELLHPTVYQLIGAISKIGGDSTVICPNGNGASEASKIKGVEKVISVNGDCFDLFDVFSNNVDIGSLRFSLISMKFRRQLLAGSIFSSIRNGFGS